MGKPLITGLFGCSCHGFDSWEECEQAHKQRFKIGDPVEHRCTGKQGYVHNLSEGGFCIVKMGVTPSENIQYHAANLIKKEKVDLEDSYHDLVVKELKWIAANKHKF
ncbi:hypothetical protein [Mongoliitalea lutea]|uniref:Uncharacterized protein n=1 Tax=Mongoliitalea lutea TaxID=849756 RepID=A0A8J3CYG8_9BACT|nr:hypothetical protein [Mongoliitalea lutea]GHB44571.1 hypothetical protein GCM10008106_27060 [Mongoliitalea lutea]